VSADALAEQVQVKAETRPDSDTRREFYFVRVRLDQDDILGRIPEFIPTPGMPADVYIKTGKRTFYRVHHEAGLRQLLPRFPRNLNGRASSNAHKRPLTAPAGGLSVIVVVRPLGNKRPRGRAAKQRYELASPHSLT
jgi:hypothetical protein